MNLRNILASLCLTAFTLCIAVVPAYGQAARTWVSGVGNDGNSCTRTSPCLTFARALTQTAAGGEIDCLDSGGFGTVNIAKSVTINCEAAIGGVQAGGGTVGINVNVTANDVVYLRGLDIIGTSNGVSGISLVQAGVLHVEHCLIHNFHFGVEVQMKDVLPCGTLVCLSDVNALTSKAAHTVTPRQPAVHRSLSHRGKLRERKPWSRSPRRAPMTLALV